ncbi:MAG TPA: heavy metal-associated domain-containing protein, partial [Longimicrobiaceae bacterium]|nr:heavy metal-associated domain-containing protein [Longimicrobiaceae bacterium]
MNEADATLRYRVIGMDCGNDAADIESTARTVEGVGAVNVSTASHILVLRGHDPDFRYSELESALARLGYSLEPLAADAGSERADVH